MADALAIQIEANNILSFITNHAKPDWHTVLIKNLQAGEYATVIKNLRAALIAKKQLAPVGILWLTTADIIKATCINQATGRAAITLLKRESRILQVGAGSGKALILLQKDPLVAEDIKPEVESEPVVLKEPTAAQMLAGLTEYITKLESKTDDVAKIDKLEKQLEENQAKLEELEQKLAQAAQITWK